MTRKIVQIAAPFCGEGAIQVTLALADDGTLWQGHWKVDNSTAGWSPVSQTYEPPTYTYVWEQIPNIPQ